MYPAIESGTARVWPVRDATAAGQTLGGSARRAVWPVLDDGGAEFLGGQGRIGCAVDGAAGNGNVGPGALDGVNGAERSRRRPRRTGRGLLRRR